MLLNFLGCRPNTPELSTGGGGGNAADSSVRCVENTADSSLGGGGRDWGLLTQPQVV